ncbi:MAG: hypothetical protein ABSC42_02375 [Tepidisphaeraceae bacterium]|jgi:hypothetical protein
MISQRWAAQLGLLAATAVFVTSIGVLISQAGNSSGNDGMSGSMISNPTQNAGMPISLSAPAMSPAARTSAAVEH